MFTDRIVIVQIVYSILHSIGVRAYYPAQAYEVTATESALTVHAPAKSIRNRGDTLDGPLLTLRCSSPLPDVIRISIGHFSGGATGGERAAVSTLCRKLGLGGRSPGGG